MGSNCGAVLSPRAGIGVGAAVAAAVVADVEAIFTWFAGGDTVDDGFADGFCAELLDSVSDISDDD